ALAQQSPARCRWASETQFRLHQSKAVAEALGSTSWFSGRTTFGCASWNRFFAAASSLSSAAACWFTARTSRAKACSFWNAGDSATHGEARTKAASTNAGDNQLGG